MSDPIIRPTATTNLYHAFIPIPGGKIITVVRTGERHDPPVEPKVKR